MRILRWIVALALAGYALLNTLPVGGTIAYRFKLFELPASFDRYVPLMQSVSWTQIALWALVIVLYLITAVRLALAKGAALPTFALAFVGDLILLIWSRQNPAYTQVFTPGERQMDYAYFAGLLVVGALIWLIERMKAR